jgi:acyl-CoA thioesterase-1
VRAADAVPKVLMLGDSITAGYGLNPEDALPVRLEAYLKGEGVAAKIQNAGVSGDTSAGGRARLGWALAEKPAFAIVALGGNDLLRGIDPKETRANLGAILAELKAKGVKTLLAGMVAPPNLGKDYVAAFDAVFPDLARKYDVALYPFLLDGVAMDRALNQPDGIHPNKIGVETLVKRLGPAVKKLLAEG